MMPPMAISCNGPIAAVGYMYTVKPYFRHIMRPSRSDLPRKPPCFRRTPGTSPARPHEIDDKPLGRKICGEAIVFYRGAEGQVAALEDFCPHRGAQLSLGTVCEGKLVCGYHGLVMGCDGKTVSMPGQRVQGFPKIRELPGGRALRLRLGLARRRRAGRCRAKIPHLEWAESPEWAYGGGLYHIHCDYRLMIDNLMDLTHETYVHTTSIGQKEIDETPVTTKAEGDHVVTSRFMENVMAPPFWRANLRGNNLADDVPVDRWQVCRFTPPSHMLIEVGVAHAGKGGYDADPKHKVSSIVVDFLTPETETSHVVLLGHGAQLQREGQGAHGADPRRPGQGLRRGHRRAGSAAAQPVRHPGAQVADAQHRRRRRAVAPHPGPADGAGAGATQPVAAWAMESLAVTVAAQEPSRPRTSSASNWSAPTARAAARLQRGLAHRRAGARWPHPPVFAVQRRGEQHRYRIAVLRDAASRGGSAAMHDAVQGRRRAARSASPGTTFPLQHAQRSLLFAGGIGVTPLLCMAQRLAPSAPISRCTTAPARPSAPRFAARSPRPAFAGRVQFHFDDGAAAQKLQLDKLLAQPEPGTHLYVCGPAGFIDWVVEVRRAPAAGRRADAPGIFRRRAAGPLPPTARSR